MRRGLASVVVAGSLLAAANGFGQAAAGQAGPEFEPAAVLRVMTRAADWQLAHPSAHAPYDWTQAAFYTGMMALAEISPDAKYLDAMRAMGEANQWRPGLRPGHADDYAVVATYAKLFQIDKNKRMLEPGLALFNFLVDSPVQRAARLGKRDRDARTGLVRRALHGAARAVGHDRRDGRPQVPRPRQPPLVEDDRVPVRQGGAPLLPRQPLLRVARAERAGRCSGAAATGG